MSFIPDAKPPKGPLARYRILSPTASLRVSPLCLGTLTFGNAWSHGLGACDKDTTNEILDFFYDNGGNFIDTAGSYQSGESEEWIGEWLKKRGVRDQMVIATKYTSCFRPGRDDELMINYQGNGTKSMRLSVQSSLDRLQTDYIDLLYLHWWDFSTSIPEVMQSLNQLVLSGKVLYLGVSDTPAWVVSKANEYARNHGLRQFSVYQGLWSAANRDFEREIIPMVKAEGMALAPWGALGSGKFKTEEQRKNTDGRAPPLTEYDAKVVAALDAVARRHDTVITSVAQAYVMHKTPYVFPIVGGRSVAHFRANFEALNLALTDEDMREIEGAAPFDYGFPSSMLHGQQAPSHPGDVWLLNTGGTTDYVPESRPIVPGRAQ